ncbi:MAG: aspartate 1-decarboxylase [Thermoanaerobaculia bacterium]
MHYQARVTVDPVAAPTAGILVNEQVEICNVTNGNRLATYAILEQRRPAAANLPQRRGGASAAKGNLVILVTYAEYDEDRAPSAPACWVVTSSTRRTASSRKRGRRELESWSGACTTIDARVSR